MVECSSKTVPQDLQKLEKVETVGHIYKAAFLGTSRVYRNRCRPTILFGENPPTISNMIKETSSKKEGK